MLLEIGVSPTVGKWKNRIILNYGSAIIIAEP
jgi:hypothetical protein